MMRMMVRVRLRVRTVMLMVIRVLIVNFKVGTVMVSRMVIIRVRLMVKLRAERVTVKLGAEGDGV